MKTVPLGHVLREFREQPNLGQEPPVLTLTEKHGFVLQSERFTKRLALKDVSGYKVVRRGDIAFNPYLLWAGAVAHNTMVDAGVISPLYPTFRVREGFDSSFVARLLLAPEIVAAYDRIAFGSVPRRRRTSVRDFLSLEIPAPPSLAEQRRIAAILDKADALRAQRRQALAHLGSLTQSLYEDMFGDPDDAPTVELLSDVASLEGGRNLVGADQGAPVKYRVLKISAVTTGRFLPEESKALPADYEPPEPHLVRFGDLLMSRANTEALVGAVAYVDQDPSGLVLPDKVWRFVWKDNASEPLFYAALLRHPSMRRRISRLATGTGGSMKNISKAKLGQMTLPKIPPSAQSAFVERLAHVPAMDTMLLDRLFSSLQARAFRGEL